MLETEWFTFAALPKTGNHWFKRTLEEAGVPYVDNGVHNRGQHNGLPRITIVREPALWLRSFWLQIHTRMGFAQMDQIQDLRGPRTEPFYKFAWRYVEEAPGAIAKCYLHYESEHELRTEHLPLDTLELLEELGVPCDKDIVVNSPPRAVSNNRPTIKDDLRSAINNVS